MAQLFAALRAVGVSESLEAHHHASLFAAVASQAPHMWPMAVDAQLIDLANAVIEELPARCRVLSSTSPPCCDSALGLVFVPI
jgi:hypothetical protein